MPWLPDLHTPAEDLAFFRDKVLRDAEVTLAGVAGRPVGFMAEAPGWIEHLYVSPDCWRAGIGSRLLREAMDRQSRLDLWTFQRNAMARAFYERHGFKAQEETDGSGNEEGEPDIRYRWVKADRSRRLG
jgi:GNAT superfamily N-acetyltransferase